MFTMFQARALRRSLLALRSAIVLLAALAAIAGSTAAADAANPCYPNVIYENSLTSTAIYALDEKTYARTSVGTAAFGSAASGLNPADGKLYYISAASSSNTVDLGVFDPATGASGDLGQITGVASADVASGVYFVRAAFSPSGAFYAQSDGSTNLYTINLSTRAATNLGAVTATSGTIPSGYGDFTFQPGSGSLYSVVQAPNADSQLYTINVTTLKATPVGTLGLGTSVNVYGVAFGDDGSGYAVDSNANIYKLNLSTGAATLVNSPGNSAVAYDLASLPQILSLDIGLAKTHANNAGTAGADVTPDGTITYTITVSNPSSSTCALQNFTVVDPVPATVQNPTFTASTGTYDSTTGAWTNVNLQPNSSVTLTVKGTVAPSATGTITNTATIALPDGINDTGNASASDSATVTPTAGITITKTGTAQAAPNGLIAYSVVVSNAGPSDASGAAFTDALPSGEAIKGTPTCATATGSATCGTVTVAGSKISSTITALPANSSVTFTIDATAAVAGTYSNTANVAPRSGETDSNPTTSSVTTTVAASNGIAKTVQNVTTGTAASATSDTGKPGDTLLYTLTYANQTGIALSNFAFGDVVPAHTTYLPNSAACAAANSTCTISTTPSTGTVTNVNWSLPTLASGSSFTVTFKVTIN